MEVVVVVWIWLMIAVDYSSIVTCDEIDAEHDQLTNHLRDQTLPICFHLLLLLMLMTC